MPHIHLLVSLKDHIKDAKKIDEFVSAELPPVPDTNDPDYENVNKVSSNLKKFKIFTENEI